jgi:hypothetical protein
MSNQALPLWAGDVSVAHWAPGMGSRSERR